MKTRLGRWFTVLSLVVALAVVFGTAVTFGQAKTEIRYALWDKNQVPAAEAIIAAFEAANPDVDVKIELIAPSSQYWDKMLALAVSKDLPDVFWVNMDRFHTLATRGVFMSMAPFLESDPQARALLADYPDVLIKAYEYEGALYGFPKDFDTIALAYNKDLFDKAKVAYPNEHWTWDDYLKAAQALTVRDARGRTVQFGTVSANAVQTNWYNFVLSNGGKMLNEDRTKAVINRPEAVEAIQFLVDLVLKYKVSPAAGATAELGVSNLNELFTTQRAAMLPIGSWYPIRFKDVPFNWGLAPMPKGAKGNGGMIHGLAHVISAYTKHKDAAWRLVRFMATDDAQQVWGKTGTVIPAKKSAQESYFKFYEQGGKDEHNIRVFQRALAYSETLQYTSNTAEWLDDTLIKQLALAWSGEKSVKQVLDECASAMDRILAEQIR
ncbi:MAG: ABC transporter substrate-binding protein [Bacillota bacterium]